MLKKLLRSTLPEDGSSLGCAEGETGASLGSEGCSEGCAEVVGVGVGAEWAAPWAPGSASEWEWA